MELYLLILVDVIFTSMLNDSRVKVYFCNEMSFVQLFISEYWK